MCRVSTDTTRGGKEVARRDKKQKAVNHATNTAFRSQIQSSYISWLERNKYTYANEFHDIHLIIAIQYVYLC